MKENLGNRIFFISFGATPEGNWLAVRDVLSSGMKFDSSTKFLKIQSINC